MAKNKKGVPRFQRSQDVEDPVETSNGTSEAEVEVSFVCRRYRELKIGKGIKFLGGLFTTSDPDLIALIRKNDLWDIHIFAQD